MNTLADIQARLDAKLREADDLKAGATGRDFTPDEQDKAGEILADIRDLTDEKRKLKRDEALKAVTTAIAEFVDGPASPPQGSSGSGVVTLEQIRALSRSAGSKGIRFAGPGAESWVAAVRNHFGAKGLSTSGTIAVPNPVLDPVRDPERPRFVADLIPSEPVTGSVAPYYRQTARTLNAAPVAITGTKPESDVGVARVESKIETIAHIIDGVHRADLSDARWLDEFIRGELFYGLRLAVDDQLLNGTGASPELQGIITDGGVQTQAWSSDLFTTIRKALTKLQLESFFDANGLVLHPNDAERMDLLQDDQGRFYFAGPQRSGSSPAWSVPVVISAEITAGQGLLGAFNNVLLFAREDARIDFTEALGFMTNDVTFRAELRMGIGILRPRAFCVIDLTA